MGLKAELNLSREGFDKMLAVFGTMQPEKHTLPTNLYEAEKLLRMLKMSYDKIHVCPKGCVLFMKEHKDANFCPKCKSSRYLEVDSGDGQKKQLLIPTRVLQHLPFLLRIQRLSMTEESAKHMTWHKDGKRYNPRKMVHSSDVEVWMYFNDKHCDKAAEARNVRVALATDGFNPSSISFQRHNIFLSLIIPRHPGSNMGVFMEPVIDELIHAWEKGYGHTTELQRQASKCTFGTTTPCMTS
jgi:ribosomal protein S27AE